MVMMFVTRFIISIIMLSSCCLTLGVNAGSMDDTFEEYAHNSLPTRPRTGVLYNASLPSNFTGVQVSLVRLRRDSFWSKGANYSVFQMPPRIFSYPNFTRLDIVFSNISNQSSYYNDYNVPNHTLVAPVVGFNVYGSTEQIGNITTPVTKLNLTLFGDPILIQFPLSQNENAKCVTFYSNGTFEMSEVTQRKVCRVRDQGHFSMAVAEVFKEDHMERRKLWKWWVFGFAIGVSGLLLIGFIIFMIIRYIRMRNIGIMEKEAQKDEALETTNVGRSKMPLATVVRTQPMLENEYVP